jgi:arylsulfatase
VQAGTSRDRAPEGRRRGNGGSRPNVIVLLTDDQGYGDLSCHGNPILRTPNLDRLHSESVVLDDFHVAPMCTPTRGQLLTGQDALRNGATFVCMGRSLLDPALPTMADILLDNGYRTGHFGKWHLGDNFPYRPQDRGFQTTIHHPAWGITSAADYFENDYFDPHFRRGASIDPFEGYCTDIWFDETINWIEQDRDAPFFAYLATNAPHGPLWVPDAYRQPYLDLVDYDVASFFGMIANIDENFGRLDAYLTKTGLRDNTILIFMGDNGTATGENIYNAGMRGRKRSLFEGGHRVPCFIRWPSGGLVGPRQVDQPTQCQDILPTLIDLCDLEGPAQVDFDGISLAATLRNNEPIADRMLVVQYGHASDGWSGATGPGDAAVIWNSWRLVGDELFDLSSDPGQETDIADRHPEVWAAMRNQYNAWWDRLGGNLGSYHPITIGSHQENPTRLCSCDWADVYCDNPGNIRGCVMDSGTWHLIAERPGKYSFSLFRWPEESDLAISAPAPLMQGIDGSIPAGRELPVVHAWMQAGDFTGEADVAPEDRCVTFETRLPDGPVHLKTWWLDADGQELAGAYYVSVCRLGPP